MERRFYLGTRRAGVNVRREKNDEDEEGSVPSQLRAGIKVLSTPDAGQSEKWLPWRE
jgi:hypothetical protein